jgi:predicted negative regulator of RcsB-dependent stress response
LQDKPEEVAKKAQILMDKYPHSPYATLSQLLLAQQAVSQQQWAMAMKHLSWIAENSRNVIFKQLAQIRYVRLLLLQKKYDDALALLETVNEPSFYAVAQEITGDILLEQGKIKSARQAYQQALAHSDDVIPAWQFVLQMKINSLPELPTGDKA